MTALRNIGFAALKKENNELNEENKVLSEKLAYAEEQLLWFNRQIFGRRSERIVDLKNEDQLLLDGFEELEPLPESEKKPVAAHERKKPKRNGNQSLTFPDDIPVEFQVIDIADDKKICPETGVALVKIGEEITQRLAHRAGSYYIKQIVRPKYALPAQEEKGIFVEELPDTILPKSRADESLLAEIVTRKFADHLPLYRLSEIFSRDGIQISRQLLSQWILRLGGVLMPLYDEMVKRVIESKNIFVDETPIQLQVKGKGKLQQAYMWVAVGGEGADPPYRVYRFYPNRKHENAFDLLKGFSGSTHSDKYGAYEKMAKADGITWHPCWNYVRRKFVEAESGDPKFRSWVLRKIRYLFMFERVAWSRNPEERLRIRAEKETPIIDELIAAVKDRVENGNVLPKSKYREALNYFYGLTPDLKNYLHHANARMDNNVAERSIRPLAIGRKNWLFVGSLDGGRSTAVLLSLVQTCRGLGINPREYLEDMMRRFLGHPANRFAELLPDNWATIRSKNG
jgi:transposase